MVSSTLFASQIQQLWSQSNQQADSKDWENALRGYEQLLVMGIKQGKLYYNMGVASFHSGDIESAMGYYLQARQYIPRNAKLQHNLSLIPAYTQYAQQHRIESFLKQITKLETLLVSGFAWLLLWIVLIMRHQIPNFVVGLSLCIGILGVSLSVWRLWFDPPLAVVKAQTPVHVAPYQKTEVVLNIEQITQVKVKELKERWVRIEIPQTPEAWVERDHLMIVKVPEVF